MATFNHLALEQLWTASGGPASHADVAAAVAQAESGGDPSRINNTAYPGRPFYKPPARGAQPEYSVGLWQVNMLAHPQYPERLLLTSGGNVGAALSISNKGESFAAWTTYTDGAYKPFLTGTSGSTGSAPSSDTRHADTVGGWHAMNHALARTLPGALNHSRRLGHATGRNLAKHRH